MNGRGQGGVAGKVSRGGDNLFESLRKRDNGTAYAKMQKVNDPGIETCNRADLSQRKIRKGGSRESRLFGKLPR